MKTLESIKKHLTALKEKNSKEIAETEKILEELEKSISKHQETLYKAEESVDYDKYNLAKKDLWTAKNKKELAAKRLKQLTTVPLVNYEEYGELIDNVVEASNQLEQANIEKAWKIILSLDEIAEHSKAIIETKRELLDTLEKDISKNSDDYKKDERGYGISTRRLGLTYSLMEPSGLVSLYERLRKEGIFKDFQD